MRRTNYVEPSTSTSSRDKQQAFSDEKRKEGTKTASSEKKESGEKKLERKNTEDINASADAFIKNFRQQLLIQRLQSIENYEQMLARGL
ncbi:hypothetical protein HN51_042516 [Arachis hypogaea]|nr:uncharacterized protein DS421_18g602710 [Arachis hypogaea]